MTRSILLMLALLAICASPLAQAGVKPATTTTVPMTNLTAPAVVSPVLSTAAAATTQAQPPAAIMPPDHKFRTPGECELLPSGEQSSCIACVARKGDPKHLYRPDYPGGVRCRLDNGMP